MSKKSSNTHVEFPLADLSHSGLCIVHINTVNGSTFVPFASNSQGSAHSRAWAFAKEEALRFIKSGASGWSVVMHDTRPVA